MEKNFIFSAELCLFNLKQNYRRLKPCIITQKLKNYEKIMSKTN